MRDLDAPIPPALAMVNAHLEPDAMGADAMAEAMHGSAAAPLSPIDVGRHHPVTQEAVDRECDALQALALRCDRRDDREGYTSAHGAAELIGLLWDALHASGKIEIRIEDARPLGNRDRNLDRHIRDIVRAELAKPGARGRLG